MKKILEITNTRHFRNVYDALVSRGDIRVVKLPKKGQYVVLDTKAPICANCKHFDKICTLYHSLSNPYDKIEAQYWDPLQECKYDRFEPRED